MNLFHHTITTSPSFLALCLPSHSELNPHTPASPQVATQPQPITLFFHTHNILES